MEKHKEGHKDRKKNDFASSLVPSKYLRVRWGTINFEKKFLTMARTYPRIKVFVSIICRRVKCRTNVRYYKSCLISLNLGDGKQCIDSLQ